MIARGTSSGPSLPRRIRTAAAIATFRCVDAFRSAPQRYVLVLSHMRAGSTLLVHLLETSRSIISTGERNVPIATTRDLHKLAVQAYRMHASLRPRRYVVDQVNHGHLTPDIRLLQQENVRTLVLVREPHAAVSSMLEVLGRYYDLNRDQAIAYYEERLPELCELARSVANGAPTPALYLTYDQLVNETADSLAALGNYLQLDDSLSEEYSMQPYTGSRGDPSDTLRSGHIVRARTGGVGTDTNGNADELAELYTRHLDELANSCLGIRDALSTEAA